MSDDDVETGSLFVANYPPFAYWRDDVVPEVHRVLQGAADPDTPLGAYVHVPFCRKRCRFCYFKVYTERSATEVRDYVDALLAEAALYARQPFVAGRPLAYLYVGGGTPSYLSSDQITELFAGLRERLTLAPDAELTFECEPGTVRPAKLAALAEAGVTRVSLGVESWSDELLELNGRAHAAKHIEPAYQMCRDAGIGQVNLDLIAGMVGETEASWLEGVRRTLDLQPDSVTIYQMEIPGNTALYRALRGDEQVGGDLAGTATKRRWVDQAFGMLQEAGYTLTSGYTAVRGDPTGKFVYRDRLWHGADMLPLGVSAFGQLGGVHLQNDKRLPSYLATVQSGELPIERGFAMADEHRFIREWVLQLKLGHVDAGYFRDKFGVDPRRRFATPLAALQRDGLVHVQSDDVRLSREGLLQVDRLLPRFFLPEHGGPQEVAGV